MDPIKEAFSKIKKDIHYLKSEILSLKSQLANLQKFNNQTTPTHNSSFETIPTNQQTNNQTTPTHNLALESLKRQNREFSTGNEGVPTDRQTNQQTNQQTENILNSSHNLSYLINPELQKDPISEFKKANEILSTLDDIKKEIREKFKRLTPQEMLVFSTLYALEDQKIPQITYKLIATNLNLSESSIRDYINKITKKGVPIEKIKQNNKTIILKISSDLKNIATLATIQRLREI